MSENMPGLVMICLLSQNPCPVDISLCQMANEDFLTKTTVCRSSAKLSTLKISQTSQESTEGGLSF